MVVKYNRSKYLCSNIVNEIPKYLVLVLKYMVFFTAGPFFMGGELGEAECLKIEKLLFQSAHFRIQFFEVNTDCMSTKKYNALDARSKFLLLQSSKYAILSFKVLCNFPVFLRHWTDSLAGSLKRKYQLKFPIWFEILVHGPSLGPKGCIQFKNLGKTVFQSKVTVLFTLLTLNKIFNRLM